VNAEDILWKDQGLYQARYEKTASALIAIAQVLDRNQLLGGRESEFLELYQRVAAADSEAFTRVWRDPTSYFWVRLAYEFVGNCIRPGPLSALARSSARARGTFNARSTLAVHLGDFKRFVLALGIVSNTEQSFHTPLEVTLPFAIPSTRLVISGEGKLLIDALADGHLHVIRHGAKRRLAHHPSSTDSLSVRESPIATARDYALMLQPEALNLAGLEVGELLRELSPSYQSDRVELTSQALELVARHSAGTFEHFREVIRLAALKPLALGDYTNVSHADLPGCFVVTAENDPYRMADYFIHEFHHNRFFFVEERGAFFAHDNDNQMTRRDYYSPFRDDPRPLHGIFHGLYVFLSVWRFWFAVYRSGETSGLRAASVSDQVLRIALQLAIAVSQLRRTAQFSALGAQLFEAMTAEVSRIQETVRGLEFPADLPAITCSEGGVFSFRREPGSAQPQTVRGSVLDHAIRYDLNRQCDDIESIVRATLA